MIDGLAVVDKPAGMTSHDVVARCRRIFAQKRVGHAGTLDPDATGVLLVGLGRATRLMQYMSALAKTYTTDIVLGASTTTLDAAGDVTGRWDMSTVTLEQARQATGPFTGDILQVPPMVSAVKIGGKRLHQLARDGVEVDRPARPVTVQRFDLTALDHGVLNAEIECSSGTYIRVLADDLGHALGGGAHVRNLRRTAVGPWRADSAVPLEDLSPEHVLPLADALPWLPAIIVDDGEARDVSHGKTISSGEGSGPWRVIGPEGTLLAVYQEAGSGRARPAVVLEGS